ncbi:hypothetical protein [Meridianimarinicoccus sp. MJW13]|uniref:hypothetical protein n=1 Tax=Meridianimarinicoccus sp. MJW13 TaxID=2720031 RepID=UPI001865F345|nr:hypothetical protein [Fluviibacterium sp. MJW13]
MRAAPIAVTLSLLALAACSPSVPDSGNVVYLEPVSPEARAARNAALQGPSGRGTVGLEPVAGSTAAVSSTPGTVGNDTTYTGAAPAQITHVTPTAVAVEQVEARPVPSRPSTGSPSVVGFALDTSHPVGQSVYARSNPSAERAARACARYASDDLAQAAFLNSGGPERDSAGIDPDGDGYACNWNPERFRKAIR